jgi:outer membrane protein assembly factor BamD
MQQTFRVGILLLLLLSMTGCGIIDYFFLPPPEDTAQELFESGQDHMKAKQFAKAAEAFARLKDRYPFSPYTPQAEIGLGDAYYLGEDYSQAVEAYREFENLHPRHEQIPYVLFQIGRSNYQQFRSIDMPQAHVADALEYFNRLVQAYPDSKFAPEAREYMVKCRRYMAEHEVFVADFYWRAEHYSAAWRRYRYITENFTDLPDVAQYAAKRADLAYLRAQENTSTKERERIQGSWKQWFDWL